jgi:16S rRNA (guanine966-N2)-methyltransferase
VPIGSGWRSSPAPRSRRARHGRIVLRAGSEATDPTARARLEAARDLRDGFELAERDWELRREGDVLGLVQSGLPSLRIASLQREGHRELATAARAAAEASSTSGASFAPAMRRSLESSPRDGLPASPRPNPPEPPDQWPRRTRAAPGGSSPGRPAAGSSHRRRGDAPDRRPREGDAVRDPGADDPRASFLDLFAGSGAAGIEALSRGASWPSSSNATRGAVAVIDAQSRRDRLRAVRPRASSARRSDVVQLGPKPGAPYAAVLIDPPYDLPELLADALRAIAAGRPAACLAPDGVAVAKHFWKTRPAGPIGLLRSARERRFGETTLTFLRWSDEQARRTDESRALSRLLRSRDERPPRRPVRAPWLSSTRSSCAVSRTRARRALLPLETRVVVLETAIRDAGIDADLRPSHLRRAHRRCGARTRRPLDRSRAARRSPTSRPRASSPTTTGPRDDVDTVFFMTAVEFGYVSSSLVKEIAAFGGDVSTMVPPAAVDGAANADGGTSAA